MGDQLEPREESDAPEVVEGEAVEAERPRATGVDDREYQEFLEFKRFKQWQATHGGDAGPDEDVPRTSTAGVAAGTPWWKKALGLLRHKAVRRILYLLLALLLLDLAYNYYFGSSDTAEEANPVQAHQDHLHTNPIRQTKPINAVRTTYDDLANKSPDEVCALDLGDAGGRALARNNGVPSCQAAAQRIKSAITDPRAYQRPNIGGAALDTSWQPQPDAVVRSCDVGVEGGPPLGDFHLHRDETGAWLITDITPAGPC